jgi:hypothetical protein
MSLARFAVVTLATLALLAGLSPAPASAATPTVDLSDPGLFEALHREAPRLRPQVLRTALTAAACAARGGQARRNEVLTVIDYSLPSTQQRLWVFDLAQRRLLWEELVAHGKNTGDDVAKAFSNVNGSKQSSLGLFRTGSTYVGGNGYSLRLHGLEPGINDLALERLIVMHGADYVSEDFIRRVGRLGRSWGCPALGRDVARPVIDAIKGGSLLYAYYPDEQLTGGSRYVRAEACGPASGAPAAKIAK